MNRLLPLAALLLTVPAVVQAESARDSLTQTAFQSRDKAAALAQFASVEAAAVATLAQTPGDREALLTRAMATSYRAKLTRSRSDALSAKAQLEALIARNPRDAEAQAALGAWHINAVEALGSFTARAALGARKATGLAAIDQAIAVGGGRALFPGLAALLRLSLDPKDAAAPALLDAAAKGTIPTLLDRQIQRRAAQIATVLKGGDARLITTLAKRLMPLGQFKD